LASAVEVTLVPFQYAGGNNVSSIGTPRNIVILPSAVSGGLEPKVYGACNLAVPSTLNCKATINALNPPATLGPTEGYVLSIRSRYNYNNAPVSYQLEFVDSSGQKISVNTQNTIIDVTARSGQSYRRLIAQLNSGPGTPGQINYVLYGDQNICKNFQLNGVNLVNQFCPTP
jgi:hypothetical protein